ncbi:hypothetical protein [Brevundimonas vesicularis]|uniref:Phage protein, HK97 gp10 family n=1 Tax=Brevundimonas vesicularis TaxID=41276 RepID=A0ABU4KNT6_BREVE|nr:hypothetical protein [Brevundimonas vesicularis]MDX2334609.1 hypothetical protein [Brevundimonas vesicularis]
MAKVTLDLRALDKMTDRAAENGLRSALGEGETILKRNILAQEGTGRIYTRGGRKHQASAPGQSPALDTGNLRANTNADLDLREEGTDLVGEIVSNTEYSEALERGTERMAARPFLGPLGTDHRTELQRAFVEGAKR